MKSMPAVRRTLAAFSAIATLATYGPVSAKPIGNWDFQSSGAFCSIGTNQNGGALVMMTTKSGASGMMVIPADQTAIVADHDYPLKISLEGSPDASTTASTGAFGGSKVLYLKINAAGIAADAADGFALRVKLNDAPIFDKNMHGSRDAFAAFIACSKAFKR